MCLIWVHILSCNRCQFAAACAGSCESECSTVQCFGSGANVQVQSQVRTLSSCGLYEVRVHEIEPQGLSQGHDSPRRSPSLPLPFDEAQRQTESHDLKHAKPSACSTSRKSASYLKAHSSISAKRHISALFRSGSLGSFR